MYEISWKERTAILMTGLALGGGGVAIGYSLGSSEANGHRETAQKAQRCVPLLGTQAMAANALPPICQEALQIYTEAVDPYGYSVNAQLQPRSFNAADVREIASQNRQSAKTAPREMANIGLLGGMFLWVMVQANAADRRRMRRVTQPQ